MGEIAVAREVVVERGVAARYGFQAVVEIEHDLVERQFIHQHDAAAAKVFELLLRAALVLEQLENAAEVLLARDHAGVDDGFFDLLDRAGVGELGRVIDFDHLAGVGGDAVAYARGGGDQVDIEFALEALLHDFQVQQAEEAAAEAEAERHGVFRLEIEGAIVEAELFEGVAQQAVFVRLHGVEPGEHHRLDFLEAGQRFGGGMFVIGDGVADLGVADRLDIGVQVADFAGLQFVAGRGLRRLVAESFHLEDLAVGHQADLLAEAYAAIEDAHQDDDAAIGVEPGVEDQGAQRQIGRPLGMRHQMDDGFQDFVDADALLGAAQDGVAGVEADDGFDLLADAFRFGGGEIDLVDDRDDFEIVVQREVGIGEGLGLHALGGVHHQQGAFAGLQAARNFVREIDVAGGIDQVELVHARRHRRGSSGGRRGL